MSVRLTIVTGLGLLIALGGPAHAFDLEKQLKQAAEPTLKQFRKPKKDQQQAQQQKEGQSTAEPVKVEGGTQPQKPSMAQAQKPARTVPKVPMLGEVPLEDEVAIGREVVGNLLGAAPLVRDAGLQRYVNRVGRWVAGQSGRAELKWTFGVIESNDINAFAAPGGYVFITRGLYARLKDEAELAGVLGHEVAHVQQKHHLKVIQKQQLLGAGTKLLQKELGEERTVQRLIGSGAEILARGLDKGAEFEADRIGVVLAARAGYDPYGLPGVLQTIGAVSSDSGSVALLFKTHPHPDERLAVLGDAMGDELDNLRNSQTLGTRLYRMN
jgi:predicted Zn-dependent protease